MGKICVTDSQKIIQYSQKRFYKSKHFQKVAIRSLHRFFIKKNMLWCFLGGMGKPMTRLQYVPAVALCAVGRGPGCTSRSSGSVPYWHWWPSVASGMRDWNSRLQIKTPKKLTKTLNKGGFCNTKKQKDSAQCRRSATLPVPCCFCRLLRAILRVLKTH